MLNQTTKMKYLVSCILTINLLLLANFVSSADVQFEINPIPADSGFIKSFDYKGTLDFTCNVTSSPPTSDYQVKWYKGSDEVSSIDELKSRVKFEDLKTGLHTLKISKPNEDDNGNYTCAVLVKNEVVNNKTYSALGRGKVKVPSNVNVVEGEKLRIHCLAIGRPLLVWEVANTTYDGTEGEDSRIKLYKDEETDLPNAILIIEEVKMSDRGYFKCIARNFLTNEDEAVAESFIRVKDKLAALWPFLGICAEVIILCAIILIYEKKRNKQELDESDTDQSPDQKNTPDHGKDTDVRHRK